VLREFTDFYTAVVVQPNTTNADLLLETDVKQLLTDRDQYNHTVTPRVDRLYVILRDALEILNAIKQQAMTM